MHRVVVVACTVVTVVVAASMVVGGGRATTESGAPASPGAPGGPGGPCAPGGPGVGGPGGPAGTVAVGTGEVDDGTRPDDNGGGWVVTGGRLVMDGSVDALAGIGMTGLPSDAAMVNEAAAATSTATSRYRHSILSTLAVIPIVCTSSPVAEFQQRIACQQCDASSDERDRWFAMLELQDDLAQAECRPDAQRDDVPDIAHTSSIIGGPSAHPGIPRNPSTGAHTAPATPAESWWFTSSYAGRMDDNEKARQQYGPSYEVTYEDGTTETMRGWSLRMVADSATDPHHEPVKIERLPDPSS